MSRIKGILWGSVGLYAVGLFLNYSQISRIPEMMRAYVDTSNIWFFIVIDVVLGGLSGFASAQVVKGNLKPAKAAMIANAAVGVIATLLSLKAGILSVVMNAALGVGGIYGWLLISKEERPLV